MVLKDPKADKATRAEALKFVEQRTGHSLRGMARVYVHRAHLAGGKGNTRHAIFDGKPDNLHWVWDTGLLEHINRNPQALAAEPESKITPQGRAEWDKRAPVGAGHRLRGLGPR